MNRVVPLTPAQPSGPRSRGDGFSAVAGTTIDRGLTCRQPCGETMNCGAEQPEIQMRCSHASQD
jgi:hypothetical protein